MELFLGGKLGVLLGHRASNCCVALSSDKRAPWGGQTDVEINEADSLILQVAFNMFSSLPENPVLPEATTRTSRNQPRQELLIRNSGFP
jgi:hypothetical protein